MRIRVIADFMPFGVFLAQKLWPFIGIEANHEKRGAHFFFFQNVQNLGSPIGIGSVVEGNGQFFLGGPDLVNMIRKRISIVPFTGNEIG